MARPKKKNPGGRPTDYRPEYCKLLIEHMAKGFSYETFGAEVDVCKQTVYTWEKHPEFLDAKKKAFTKCQKFWEQQGTLGLWNDPKGESLNSSVWIFNMKNRFKWADRQEIEQKVDAKIVEENKELIEELTAVLSHGLDERKKKSST